MDNIRYVRCHAVICDDVIHRNSVIAYSGDEIVSDINPCCVNTSLISVIPFSTEQHSTISYNGIAVIGKVKDSMALTAENFLDNIKSIFTHIVPDDSMITFMPLV